DQGLRLYLIAWFTSSAVPPATITPWFFSAVEGSAGQFGWRLCVGSTGGCPGVVASRTGTMSERESPEADVRRPVGCGNPALQQPFSGEYSFAWSDALFCSTRDRRVSGAMTWNCASWKACLPVRGHAPLPPAPVLSAGQRLAEAGQLPW